MSTQHVGAAGELLVRYRLLKLGIDSAGVTTDPGVDLVAYAPVDGAASTVQVKTVREPTPAGGRGAPAVGWNFHHGSPAQLLALVLLSTDEVWLFTMDEARRLAQQHSESGTRRLYWYVGDAKPAGVRVGLRSDELTPYLLEHRAAALFPPAQGGRHADAGTDDLADAIEDDFPSCPRCDTRLDDAGTDTMAIRLRCPNCGLDFIAGQ